MIVRRCVCRKNICKNAMVGIGLGQNLTPSKPRNTNIGHNSHHQPPAAAATETATTAIRAPTVAAHRFSGTKRQQPTTTNTTTAHDSTENDQELLLLGEVRVKFGLCPNMFKPAQKVGIVRWDRARNRSTRKDSVCNCPRLANKQTNNIKQPYRMNHKRIITRKISTEVQHYCPQPHAPAVMTACRVGPAVPARRSWRNTALGRTGLNPMF